MRTAALIATYIGAGIGMGLSSNIIVVNSTTPSALSACAIITAFITAPSIMIGLHIGRH